MRKRLYRLHRIKRFKTNCDKKKRLKYKWNSRARVMDRDRVRDRVNMKKTKNPTSIMRRPSMVME